MRRKEKIETLKRYYKEEKKDIHNIDTIRYYFDINEANEYTLDDQTWDDLDMDRVFYKIDRSYSSPGESMLYKMLRNPVMDEEILKERNKHIEKFKNNKNLRGELQSIFYDLGFDKKSYFLQMMNSEFTINKSKKIVYTILGIAPLILMIIGFFLRIPQIFLGGFAIAVFNSVISSKEKKNVHTNGLIYLNELLVAAKRIDKLNAKENLTSKFDISPLIKELSYIKRATGYVNLLTTCGGFFEPIGIPFLILESSYYKLTEELEKKEDAVLELYEKLGEIECYISMSIYQEIIDDNYSHPKFVDKVKLEIKDGIHPLLKKPVSNSILLDKKGVVLTGTNMSGKSTFLRMLGINMLFAQTFYFTLTSKYECCFFNIVSSISPKDDVNSGKSYYMAEAEAILRIIESLKKPVPVFCIIDEIFRGTNPIERISASAAILKYISNEKALTFVATHDRELTDMLKETYDFYYFSEDVNEDDGLSFDYKLKTGISKTRNAIKLLDYIGYPKEITNNARDFAKKLD